MFEALCGDHAILFRVPSILVGGIPPGISAPLTPLDA